MTDGRLVMRRSRIRQRLLGVPRNLAELNRSLQHLASLRDLGWHQSLRHHASVDAHGRPLPWYTYPCIEWLADQLRASDTVFEYGGGWSTLWYADRVRRVASVEHDEGWHTALTARIPENVELHFRRPGPEDEEPGQAEPSPYVSCIQQYPAGSFDVVVVDGVERTACTRSAVNYLKPDGLLILDNSDRPAYRGAIELLAGHGFGRIDFYGNAPGSGLSGCTSVFALSFDRWVKASSVLRTWGA
jgi:hypothetical protein